MSKKKNKKSRGSKKGTPFERKICKQLSLWWSGGKTDGVFWRTDTSGGRATVRAKKGKKTPGQYGDVCATDPRGVPFLKCFTIELKCGYPDAIVHTLLDKLDSSKPPLLEQFFQQAEQQAEKAGSISWMLITKRDRKKEVVWTPLNRLGDIVNSSVIPVSKVIVYEQSNKEMLLGLLLDDFLKTYTRKDFTK